MNLLLGTFFTITNITKQSENQFHLNLHLDKSHPIFSGHFPGNPIVPGVCLTQMLKEIMEQILQKPLLLSKAASIKFTAIVNPEEQPELEANLNIKPLDDKNTQAELTYFSGNTTFYKFKGTFKAS